MNKFDGRFFYHPDFRETCFELHDFDMLNDGFIQLQITWWNTGKTSGKMYEMFDDTIRITPATFSDYKEIEV